MDYINMTAPCGLDCFNCPVYLARENERLRAAISKNMDIPYEQAVCSGCRNEKGTIAFLGMTEPCNVYKCIEKKGISFCCECSDFPCDHLHPYADKASERPHNTKVFNLNLIKKMGVESWAEKRQKASEIRISKGNLNYNEPPTASCPAFSLYLAKASVIIALLPALKFQDPLTMKQTGNSLDNFGS